MGILKRIRDEIENPQSVTNGLICFWAAAIAVAGLFLFGAGIMGLCMRLMFWAAGVDVND